jgi:hypothetical protein
VKSVRPAKAPERHSRESGNPVSFVRTTLGPRFRGDDDISVHSRRTGFGHLTDGARHHDLRKCPSPGWRANMLL